MTPIGVAQGSGPVLLGMPHTGTHMLADIAARLNATGRALADTDWHIHKLYEDLLPDATIVRVTFHRYLIDANRDPTGESLYPGQLLTDFDGRPIWNAPPDEVEIEARRQAFHMSYHAALSTKMERVRAMHCVVILYACHSIRAKIPFLFDGVLPDFNIGTNNGASCARVIETATHEIWPELRLSHPHRAERPLQGRLDDPLFWPAAGWHAIQMELAQSTYLALEAAPWALDDDNVARMRPILAKILRDLAHLAPILRGEA